MTTPAAPAVITSTKDLTPDKILGYAKGIAFAVGAVITALAEVIDDTWPYKRYLQGALLLCTVIAGVQIPNAVKPVVVVPVDAAIAGDVQVDAVTVPVDPEPLLGVVQPPQPEVIDDPPGEHAARE